MPAIDQTNDKNRSLEQLLYLASFYSNMSIYRILSLSVEWADPGRTRVV